MTSHSPLDFGSHRASAKDLLMHPFLTASDTKLDLHQTTLELLQRRDDGVLAVSVKESVAIIYMMACLFVVSHNINCEKNSWEMLDS